MRLPDWLVTESEAWQRDGLITEDQRREILARYPASVSAADRAAAALTWLAVIAAGIGAVVLVAWNWTSIPNLVKVLMSVGPMVGLYAAAVSAVRSGHAARAERLALGGALFAGGVLFLTEDLVHIDLQHTSAALLWAALLATTALLVPSALIAAVGLAVSLWWLVSAGDAGAGIWWFAFVWPLFAIAIERAPNRWVAGGVTFVLGVWVFFAMVTVWPDHAIVPALAALMTGSWIDLLAHAPAPKRPAFARSTAALAMTLIALLFLLPLASHKTMADWHAWTGSLWAAGALLVSLVAAVGWIALRDGAWRSRAVALTAVATVWLIVWFVVPAETRSNDWQPWSWTIVFSVAAVLTGASIVREGARRRDVGLFAIGLLTVVAFLIIRVVDAQSLIVSGLMLLVAAAGLAWLARAWNSADREGPESRVPSPGSVPSSGFRVLSARGIIVALCLAILVTGSHAAYRWWPALRGTEILMPAALFKQPSGFNLVLVQLPIARVELDVAHGGPSLNEAFVSVRRAGDWWIETDGPRKNSRVLRGQQLYLQLVPGGAALMGGASEMRADSVSDAPVAGAMNLAGRVRRVRDDGYLWLDYSVGWIAVSADVAAHARPLDMTDAEPPRRPGLRPVPPATDPGVYAILRVLPSGRAALTGLIVNSTRY